MCIIAIKPADKEMFPEKQIRYMFSKNPDGAGLAYALNGEVHYKKGFMDVEKLVEYLNKHKKLFKGLPLILHFRIGTSGKKDEYNCHPYPVFEKNKVIGKSELVMAHNGVLYNFNPPLGATYNDTQCFIKKALSLLPHNFLNNESISTLIKESVGTNRLCFLDKDGKITKFGSWYKEDGYEYSNSGYKEESYRPFYIPQYPSFQTSLFKKEDKPTPKPEEKASVDEEKKFANKLYEMSLDGKPNFLSTSELMEFYSLCQNYCNQMDDDMYTYSDMDDCLDYVICIDGYLNTVTVDVIPLEEGDGY